ncbi:type III secretion system stator protein SctL [Variovorax saccharolyticus]|uniref:type III secretion system stator protein SctL n=1 Tax=Variovorax saccharolyticus TaxID=3053516 RepID=UPI0025765091|nr:type III secretion system stator protein SctL [Variovorax sp. J31P216]MDM0030159.1 type III secretion system stator protein SctL [Variovorax sp. J31P216]
MKSRKPVALRPPSVPGTVIRRATIDALRTAEEIMESARQEAAAVRAEAQVEAQEVVRSAVERGRADAEGQAVTLTMEAVLRRDAYLASVEGQLAGVVTTAVRRLIDGFDEMTLARSVVTSALLALRGRTEATVRVSPVQLDAIKSHGIELRRRCPGLDVIEFVADPSLPVGACVVISEMGTISTDLASQLHAIESAVARVLDSGNVQTAVTLKGASR